MINMSLLLVPYFLTLLLAFIFLLINLFHMVRFGLQSTKTNVVIILYVSGFVFVFLVSILLITPHDWSGTFDAATLLKPRLNGQNLLEL